MGELALRLTELEAEVHTCRKQCDEAQSLFEHERASFLTHKRRHARDLEAGREAGQAVLLKALLPVLDNFERAVFHGALEKGRDDPILEGIRLTYESLWQTLASFGLEPMDTVGRSYDPHLHEAVDKLATNEQPENTIVEEFEKGYTFKGTLLRPAKVRVAVTPGDAAGPPSGPG